MNGPPDSAGGGASFSFSAGPIWFYRVLLVGVFAPMGLIAVPLLVGSTARGDGPPAWFAFVWIAILAWNIYWWIFRIVFEITITRGRLEWRGALRSGSVPLTGLRRLRPSGFGSNIEVVETDSGNLIVLTRRGFSAFCDALHAELPALDIRVGWQARFADAWPSWWPTGGSGFKRHDRDRGQSG